ncbi:hypothetical protein CDD83_493 [Cordyceps sp. RAO-2017]|nr:hypothetical protein CDD83_493 [Cordyceps sp. RAO-2017]
MTSGLHCTHLLFLAHAHAPIRKRQLCPARQARSSQPSLSDAKSSSVFAMAPEQSASKEAGRSEEGTPPGTAQERKSKETPAQGESEPHPGYVPDEQELERRRLGEAQPQVVPAEVIASRSSAARSASNKGTAR